MKNNLTHNILKGFLCNCNPKLPLSNNHYITGKNIWLFSNMVQIENTLTCFTSNICCKFHNVIGKLKM